MSIKQQLADDLTVALKAGDKLKTMVLRGVIGAYKTAEKAGKEAVEFSDEEVLVILKKEAKRRSETAEEYLTHGVADRAEKEKAEADIINAYLPASLTHEEVIAIVDEAAKGFENPTQKDMGSIMKLVNEQVQGRADGKTIAELVRAKLV